MHETRQTRHISCLVRGCERVRRVQAGATRRICPERVHVDQNVLKIILYRAVVLTASAMMLLIAGVAWRFAPRNPEELMQRGWARARSGHYTEAARDFSEVLRAIPQRADARLLRGCCFASAGEHTAAIDDFNKCLLLNGGNAAAWHDRGMAYQQMGDWKNAAHDFDAALQLRPNDAQAASALKAANENLSAHASGEEVVVLNRLSKK
jgi:tetratricopeptide (TPR) repeat protein